MPKTVEREATETLGEVTGRRRALFVGINYFGQEGELKGCINDVKEISHFFTANYDIDEQEVAVMTDNPEYPENLPTRANIVEGFHWLIDGAAAGDSLIFYYSGHGRYVKDEDGDEKDGMDECLLPVDYQEAGIILDDDIHAILCRGLPKGVRLTAIIDSCHSGSMLDLPYLYTVDGNLQIVKRGKRDAIFPLLASGCLALIGGPLGSPLSLYYGLKGMKRLTQGAIGSLSKAQKKAIKTRSTDADCIQISGCMDPELSAEYAMRDTETHDVTIFGAMSFALMKALSEKKNQDYTTLLQKMRQFLKENGFKQVPCLSAGRELILNHPFTL